MERKTENRGGRVLVVDDDPDVVDLICRYLQGANDELTVETATDPRDALATVEGQTIHCVVSDYEMPWMDGLELLTAVREREPGIPFVLFTNSDVEGLAERTRERDAIYLEKGMRADSYRQLIDHVQRTVASE